MNYADYTLSMNSCYLPALGECLDCPFINKCNSGAKCLVKKDTIKHRNKKAYYQKHKEEYKKRARQQWLEQKTIKQQNKVDNGSKECYNN